MNLAALEEKLSDPVWRICSGELYSISPADGTGVQPFRPRPEQEAIVRAIYVDGAKQILIPKARRLGMSTTLGIIIADAMIFRKGFQASLIDQNAADASRKLDRIVRVALENLPLWLKERLKFSKDNDSHIAFDLNGSGERTFYAGMNARGGSNDFLWISELGVIQFEDPKRSSKIRSGALPSARHGITVIETTWAGGRTGDLWELLEPTLTGKAHDWKIMFFPWYVDPRNASQTAVIDDEAKAYFQKIAPQLTAAGINLSEEQMRWYSAERRAQGVFMKRENPTFLEECWSAPVQGAIYTEQIEKAHAQGRIFKMPVDGLTPVYTAWDLGAPANMAVAYFQISGREIRVIDWDIGDKGTLVERVAYMLGKGYPYAKHFLPHDAVQTERSGSTFLSELAKAGLPSGSLSVIPRVADIWIGINGALSLFPALTFRVPQCERALELLACYRMKVTGVGALTTTEPVHDGSSHCADSFRMIAEAHLSGLIKFKYADAETKPEYYFGERAKRRGMRPQRVS